MRRTILKTEKKKTTPTGLALVKRLYEIVSQAALEQNLGGTTLQNNQLVNFKVDRVR